MKLIRFKDLKVWQLAHELSLDVAKLVRSFPKDEKYDLAGQMRRSARSIPSEIGEGFGRFHFRPRSPYAAAKVYAYWMGLKIIVKVMGCLLSMEYSLTMNLQEGERPLSLERLRRHWRGLSLVYRIYIVKGKKY